MARLPFLDDPAEMTPELRLAEVAAILAAAWLRQFSRRPLTEKPLDSSRAPMALCDNGLSPDTENAA